MTHLTKLIGQMRAGQVFMLLLIGTVALSAGLRLFDLSAASLSADEAVTTAFAQLPWSAILFDRIDNHPVLSFLIQKAWWQIAPDTDWLRLPSAVAGVGSVLVAGLMMRDIVSERAGLLAALLTSLSAALIFYSQDARMYSFLVFGLFLALWGQMGLSGGGRQSRLAYGALYAIGGAIAIHSHLLGLAAMAFLALPACLLMLTGPKGGLKMTLPWLGANICLLFLALPWLVQIPNATGTFPGYGRDLPGLADMIWYFRGATGIPGLGPLSAVFELGLYGSALWGLLALWRGGSRPQAASLMGLIVLYPMFVFAMTLRQDLLSVRAFLPAIVGVLPAASIALANLTGRSRLILPVLLGAMSVSAIHLLSTVNRFENYGGAFTAVDRLGYESAPVVTCNHFWAAGLWEARPESEIYLYRGDAVFRYPGRSYWEAARQGMSQLRQASADDLERFIGSQYRIRGGLGAALGDRATVVLIWPYCPATLDDDIRTALGDLGFSQEARLTILDGAPTDIMIETPQTELSVFDR